MPYPRRRNPILIKDESAKISSYQKNKIGELIKDINKPIEEIKEKDLIRSMEIDDLYDSLKHLSNPQDLSPLFSKLYSPNYIPQNGTVGDKFYEFYHPQNESEEKTESIKKNPPSNQKMEIIIGTIVLFILVVIGIVAIVKLKKKN